MILFITAVIVAAYAFYRLKKKPAFETLVNNQDSEMEPISNKSKPLIEDKNIAQLDIQPNHPE